MNLTKKPKPIERVADLRKEHVLVFEVGVDGVCDIDFVDDITIAGEVAYVEMRDRNTPPVQLGIDEELGVNERVYAFRLLPLGSNEI